MLAALLASYADWGGRAQPPTIAIVDWREVPTWTEFEILRDAFVVGRRADRSSAIRASSSSTAAALTAGGHRIDLVYRRVLINDILAAPDECRALVDAYRAHAVCVANTFRCKLAAQEGVLRRPDRSAPCRPCSRRASSRPSARTCPGRGWSPTPAPRRGGAAAPASSSSRATGREQLVLKPNDEYGGTGVVLGWETSRGALGRRRSEGAGGSARHVGGAGADPGAAGDPPAVRRRRPGDDDATCWSTWRRICSAAGWADT